MKFVEFSNEVFFSSPGVVLSIFRLTITGHLTQCITLLTLAIPIIFARSWIDVIFPFVGCFSMAITKRFMSLMLHFINISFNIRIPNVYSVK